MICGVPMKLELTQVYAASLPTVKLFFALSERVS